MGSNHLFEEMASLHPHPYYSLNESKMREKVMPLVEDILSIIQDSGISMLDALDIPYHLEYRIKECNEYANDKAKFCIYSEDYNEECGYRPGPEIYK